MSDTNNPETVLDDDDDMPEFDFSKAERGKFYRPNALLCIPVYLDQKILAWLTVKAESKGVSVEAIRLVEPDAAPAALPGVETAQPGASAALSGEADRIEPSADHASNHDVYGR